jgi:hypothetical protein
VAPWRNGLAILVRRPSRIYNHDEGIGPPHFIEKLIPQPLALMGSSDETRAIDEIYWN